MLLRVVLRKVWGQMPAIVLASRLTTEEGRDLPSKRASQSIFPQLLPRRSAERTATYLIKDPRRWENDVSPEAAAEIEEVLTRHIPELAATAEMFEILPKIAGDEGIDLRRVGDDRFFKLAYRAAVRQLSGCAIDGDALRALLGVSNDDASDDGQPRRMYDEVRTALADSAFRTTLERVMDDGASATVQHQAASFVTGTWDDVILLLARLLENPGRQCLVELESNPPWDVVLDAGASRWGLRHTTAAGPVALGNRVPNALPPPLDRTVAERLGNLVGRGTDGQKLKDAGRSAHELLLESAARAIEPLGLSEPSSRSVLALALLGADLLQAEDPSEVTDRYGDSVTRFGVDVSRSFSSATRLLRFFDPAESRDDEGGGDDHHEGDLDRQGVAGADDYLVERGLADALRSWLSDDASDEMVAAVWSGVHRREVFGLESLTVATAVKMIRGRAVHVSNEMSRVFRNRAAAERKRVRLLGDIMKVLDRMSPEDQRAIATKGVQLSVEVKLRLQDANEAARREDPHAEWISASKVRRFVRGHDGNG